MFEADSPSEDEEEEESSVFGGNEDVLVERKMRELKTYLPLINKLLKKSNKEDEVCQTVCTKLKSLYRTIENPTKKLTLRSAIRTEKVLKILLRTVNKQHGIKEENYPAKEGSLSFQKPRKKMSAEEKFANAPKSPMSQMYHNRMQQQRKMEESGSFSGAEPVKSRMVCDIPARIVTKIDNFTSDERSDLRNQIIARRQSREQQFEEEIRIVRRLPTSPCYERRVQKIGTPTDTYGMSRLDLNKQNQVEDSLRLEKSVRNLRSLMQTRLVSKYSNKLPKSTTENKDKTQSTTQNKDNKTQSTTKNKDNKTQSTTQNKGNKIPPIPSCSVIETISPFSSTLDMVMENVKQKYSRPNRYLAPRPPVKIVELPPESCEIKRPENELVSKSGLDNRSAEKLMQTKSDGNVALGRPEPKFSFFDKSDREDIKRNVKLELAKSRPSDIPINKLALLDESDREDIKRNVMQMLKMSNVSSLNQNVPSSQLINNVISLSKSSPTSVVCSSLSTENTQLCQTTTAVSNNQVLNTLPTQTPLTVIKSDTLQLPKSDIDMRNYKIPEDTDMRLPPWQKDTDWRPLNRQPTNTASVNQLARQEPLSISTCVVEAKDHVETKDLTKDHPNAISTIITNANENVIASQIIKNKSIGTVDNVSPRDKNLSQPLLTGSIPSEDNIAKGHIGKNESDSTSLINVQSKVPTEGDTKFRAESIRSKLSEEITTLHKVGSSSGGALRGLINKDKMMPPGRLASLKPGTLIDLIQEEKPQRSNVKAKHKPNQLHNVKENSSYQNISEPVNKQTLQANESQDSSGLKPRDATDILSKLSESEVNNLIRISENMSQPQNQVSPQNQTTQLTLWNANAETMKQVNVHAQNVIINNISITPTEYNNTTNNSTNHHQNMISNSFWPPNSTPKDPRRDPNSSLSPGFTYGNVDNGRGMLNKTSDLNPQHYNEPFPGRTKNNHSEHSLDHKLANPYSNVVLHTDTLRSPCYDGSSTPDPYRADPYTLLLQQNQEMGNMYIPSPISTNNNSLLGYSPGTPYEREPLQRPAHLATPPPSYLGTPSQSHLGTPASSLLGHPHALHPAAAMPSMLHAMYYDNHLRQSDPRHMRNYETRADMTYGEWKSGKMAECRKVNYPDDHRNYNNKYRWQRDVDANNYGQRNRDIDYRENTVTESPRPGNRDADALKKLSARDPRRKSIEESIDRKENPSKSVLPNHDRSRFSRYDPRTYDRGSSPPRDRARSRDRRYGNERSSSRGRTWSPSRDKSPHRKASDRSNRHRDDRDRHSRRDDRDKDVYSSPLDKLYSNVSTPKTGLGYGFQNFRIPKINKTPRDRSAKPVLRNESALSETSDEPNVSETTEILNETLTEQNESTDKVNSDMNESGEQSVKESEQTITGESTNKTEVSRAKEPNMVKESEQVAESEKASESKLVAESEKASESKLVAESEKASESKQVDESEKASESKQVDEYGKSKEAKLPRKNVVTEELVQQTLEPAKDSVAVEHVEQNINRPNMYSEDLQESSTSKLDMSGKGDAKTSDDCCDKQENSNDTQEPFIEDPVLKPNTRSKVKSKNGTQIIKNEKKNNSGKESNNEVSRPITRSRSKPSNPDKNHVSKPKKDSVKIKDDTISKDHCENEDGKGDLKGTKINDTDKAKDVLQPRPWLNSEDSNSDNDELVLKDVKQKESSLVAEDNLSSQENIVKNSIECETDSKESHHGRSILVDNVPNSISATQTPENSDSVEDEIVSKEDKQAITMSNNLGLKDDKDNSTKVTNQTIENQIEPSLEIKQLQAVPNNILHRNSKLPDKNDLDKNKFIENEENGISVPNNNSPSDLSSETSLPQSSADFVLPRISTESESQAATIAPTCGLDAGSDSSHDTLMKDNKGKDVFGTEAGVICNQTEEHHSEKSSELPLPTDKTSASVTVVKSNSEPEEGVIDLSVKKSTSIEISQKIPERKHINNPPTISNKTKPPENVLNENKVECISKPVDSDGKVNARPQITPELIENVLGLKLTPDKLRKMVDLLSIIDPKDDESSNPEELVQIKTEDQCIHVSSSNQNATEKPLESKKTNLNQSNIEIITDENVAGENQSSSQKITKEKNVKSKKTKRGRKPKKTTLKSEAKVIKTTVKSDVNVTEPANKNSNKKQFRKHKNELDKLQADIRGYYDADAIAAAAGPRMCRLQRESQNALLTSFTQSSAQNVQTNKKNSNAKRTEDDESSMGEMDEYESDKSTNEHLKNKNTQDFDSDSSDSDALFLFSQRIKSQYGHLIDSEAKEKIDQSPNVEAKKQKADKPQDSVLEINANKNQERCNFSKTQDREMLSADKGATKALSLSPEKRKNNKTFDEISEQEDNDDGSYGSEDDATQATISHGILHKYGLKKPKKRSFWKSGIIKKKTKQKKEVVIPTPYLTNETAFEDVLQEEDEMIDSGDASAEGGGQDGADDFQLADVAYYQEGDLKVADCKLCSYSGKTIVSHYAITHPKDEVMIARMSPKAADRAIKESNWFFTLSDDKKKEFQAYKCRICEQNFPKFITFFEHMALHSGEYRHECCKCGYRTSTRSGILKHCLTTHGSNTNTKANCRVLYKEPVEKTFFVGFLCSLCNFFQISQSNVRRHLEISHDNNEVNNYIIKINFSKLAIKDSDLPEVDCQSYLPQNIPPSLELPSNEQKIQKSSTTDDQSAESCDDSVVNNKKPTDITKEIDNTDIQVPIQAESLEQKSLDTDVQSSAANETEDSEKLTPVETNLKPKAIEKEAFNFTVQLNIQESIETELWSAYDLKHAEAISVISNIYLKSDLIEQLTVKQEEDETSSEKLLDSQQLKEENEEFSESKSDDTSACNVEGQLQGKCRRLALLDQPRPKKSEKKYLLCHPPEVYKDVDISTDNVSEVLAVVDKVGNIEIKHEVYKVEDYLERMKDFCNNPQVYEADRSYYVSSLPKDSNLSEFTHIMNQIPTWSLEPLKFDEISVGGLMACKVGDGAVFHCSIKSFKKTCEFQTKCLELFGQHVNSSHHTSGWNGTCGHCFVWFSQNFYSHDKTSIYTQSRAFCHLVQEHLTFTILPSKDLDKTASIASPTQDTTDSPVGNVPRLRVRRLSGDKLSTHATHESEEGASPLDTDSSPELSAPFNPEAAYTTPPKQNTVVKITNPRPKSMKLQPVSQGSPETVPKTPEPIHYAELEGETPLVITATNVAIYKMPSSFKIMCQEPKLRHFYKCMGAKCSFTTPSSRVFAYHFDQHLAKSQAAIHTAQPGTSAIHTAQPGTSAIHTAQPGTSAIHTDQPASDPHKGNWKLCPYCLTASQTSKAYTVHMKKYHGDCTLQCAYCFYRAKSIANVHFHSALEHPKQELCALQCELCDVTLPATTEKHFSEFVTSLRCGEGCAVYTYMLDTFCSHLEHFHKGGPLKCHLCTDSDNHKDVVSLLEHYKEEHGIALYQCLYCVNGSSTEFGMKHHLCYKHADKAPKAIHRINNANKVTNGVVKTKECLKRIVFEKDTDKLMTFVKPLPPKIQGTTTSTDTGTSQCSPLSSAVFPLQSTPMPAVTTQQSLLKMCTATVTTASVTQSLTPIVAATATTHSVIQSLKLVAATATTQFVSQPLTPIKAATATTHSVIQSLKLVAATATTQSVSRSLTPIKAAAATTQSISQSSVSKSSSLVTATVITQSSALPTVPSVTAGSTITTNTTTTQSVLKTVVTVTTQNNPVVTTNSQGMSTLSAISDSRYLKRILSEGSPPSPRKVYLLDTSGKMMPVVVDESSAVVQQSLLKPKTPVTARMQQRPPKSAIFPPRVPEVAAVVTPVASLPTNLMTSIMMLPSNIDQPTGPLVASPAKTLTSVSSEYGDLDVSDIANLSQDFSDRSEADSIDLDPAPNSSDQASEPAIEFDENYFTCGNKGCLFKTGTASLLRNHLVICDQARQTHRLSCTHCNKVFKQGASLIDHLYQHGPPRFSCGLCSVRNPTQARIISHMRGSHQVSLYDLVPADNTKQDLEKDFFVITPKERRSRGDKGSKGASKAKPEGMKTKYTPEELGEIPKTAIFPTQLGCALCKYKTKVRSNLMRHIAKHSGGTEVSAEEVVNPVPEKSEKMFDKMMNLAGSSHKKKSMVRIEEVECQYKYVEDQLRYMCHNKECGYRTLTETMLRNHAAVIHKDDTFYICPHCDESLPIENLGLHLKLHDSPLFKCSYCCHYGHIKRSIERHQMLCHWSEQTSVQTVRMAKPLPAHTLPSTSKSPSSALPDEQGEDFYQCTLCKFRTKKRKLMLSHGTCEHQTTKPFACSKCTYQSASDALIHNHFKTVHVDETDCHVVNLLYSKVTVLKRPAPVPIAPLWKRDVKRLKLIRGIKLDEQGNAPPPVATCVNMNVGDLDILELKYGSFGKPGASGVFVCPRCPTFQTRNRQEMREHLYKDLEYKPMTCKICKTGWTQKPKITKHISKVHNMDCERVPSLIEYVVNKEMEEWVEKVISSQQDLMEQPSTPKKRRRSSDATIVEDELKLSSVDKKKRDKCPSRHRFMCEYCNKTAKYKNSIAMHTKKYHPGLRRKIKELNALNDKVEVLKCVHCNCAAMSLNYMKTHWTNVHKGNGVGFSFKKIKTDSKCGHKCFYCDKRCAISSLEDHCCQEHPEQLFFFSIHYQCSECPLDFDGQDMLQVHMSAEHPPQCSSYLEAQKPSTSTSCQIETADSVCAYKCFNCGYTNPSYRTVVLHIEEHFVTYVCPACDVVYHSAFSIRSHLNAKHGGRGVKKLVLKGSEKDINNGKRNLLIVLENGTERKITEDELARAEKAETTSENAGQKSPCKTKFGVRRETARKSTSPKKQFQPAKIKPFKHKKKIGKSNTFVNIRSNGKSINLPLDILQKMVDLDPKLKMEDVQF